MAKRRRRKLPRHSPRAGVRLWPLLVLIFALMAGTSLLFSAASSGRGGTPRSDGRRLTPSGASHAGGVLTEQGLRRAGIHSARTRRAYAVAAAQPELLNTLYCWCGCIERGMRSALECFESLHASRCELCLKVALAAGDGVVRGVIDPGTIQREVDRRSGHR